METVARLAHRWRYAVVAVEILLAGGCVYFGWNAVARGAAAAPIRVHHSTPGRDDAIGSAAVPSAGTASLHSSVTRGRMLQAPNLTPDWLSRVNADDYNLYRGQWQTLQLLMFGVRRYLEQRVVPRLLGQ